MPGNTAGRTLDARHRYRASPPTDADFLGLVGRQAEVTRPEVGWDLSRLCTG